MELTESKLLTRILSSQLSEAMYVMLFIAIATCAVAWNHYVAQ